MSARPEVHCFFDKATSTCQYVVVDPATRAAALIDTVHDYDLNSGNLSETAADQLAAFVRERELHVEWLLETHAHADHLSGAQVLKRALGGRVAIGANITAVQATFKQVFNLDDLATDASQWDAVFADGDTFQLGALECRVLHTPGHTPACVSYVVGDAVFSGDTLFMPDFGSARCDFPGGSAATLYASIQRLYALPDDTRMFVGHDYQPNGREVQWETTIGEQKRANKHCTAATSEADFVRFRSERDAQLSAPRLLIPSIQVNVRAGELPPAEHNGTTYLKVPLNVIPK